MSCGMVRFKLLVSLAGFSIFSVDRMLSVKSCVDQIYVQRRTPEPNLYHLLTRGAQWHSILATALQVSREHLAVDHMNNIQKK